MPALSVCMATFNGERHVGEQLRSILSQLAPDDELIVVDDASVDRTVERVQAMGDARIQLHRNGRNQGIVPSFERALSLAQGEFVFLADQDDLWLPGKVDAMSAVLRAGADLVVSDCRVVDGALQPLRPSFFAIRRSGPGLWRNLARNSYLGCCMALRRDLLQSALPFPPHLPMHDWWLGLVGEVYGRTAFVGEPLLLYRRHRENASTTAERSTASIARRLRWRLQLASELLALRLRRPPPRRPARRGPGDGPCTSA